MRNNSFGTSDNYISLNLFKTYRDCRTALFKTNQILSMHPKIAEMMLRSEFIILGLKVLISRKKIRSKNDVMFAHTLI